MNCGRSDPGYTVLKSFVWVEVVTEVEGDTGSAMAWEAATWRIKATIVNFSMTTKVIFERRSDEAKM